MKRLLILSALALAACSSTTAPINSLSGHWGAEFHVDSSGALTNIWTGALTESGESISGAVLCGGSVQRYTVSGQVVRQLITTSLNLTLIGDGNDTARLTGTVRDSMNYGVVASGTFTDPVAGQCLSGSGHWFARQISSP